MFKIKSFAICPSPMNYRETTSTVVKGPTCTNVIPSKAGNIHKTLPRNITNTLIPRLHPQNESLEHFPQTAFRRNRCF